MFLQRWKRNHCLFVVLPRSPGAWATLKVHVGNLLALAFLKMKKKIKSKAPHGVASNRGCQCVRLREHSMVCM